jgi:transposase
MSYLSCVLEKLPKESKCAIRLPDGLRNSIKYAAVHLKGSNRRIFIATTVRSVGEGGQRMAEKVLEWNRGTIRKGMHELERGIHCVDSFSGRGRKLAEEHLSGLLEDITDIVKPSSQADPTFRTTKLYTPLTAKNVHKRLFEQKKYVESELPTIRTISTKLNNLNFHPQKVAKTKPAKKIKETDAIFKQVHIINRKADRSDGVLRLSMDAKAKVDVGPFSRRGKSRQGEMASDHDYEPEDKLTPFGIFLPFYNESFFYFTRSKVTADFMIDCLQSLWPTLKQQFKPNTLVINLDNGPENNSHRTQFIKRIVDFVYAYSVNIKLAYYPPYHSKYNPIERVWGVLENHWNGEILYSIEKVLGLARTMTYNGINPVVELIGRDYLTGVKLDKKTMNGYEEKIVRLSGLEKWFVDIPSAWN